MRGPGRGGPSCLKPELLVGMEAPLSPFVPRGEREKLSGCWLNSDRPNSAPPLVVNLCSLLFNSRLSSQNPKTKSQKLKLPPNMIATKIDRAAKSIASKASPTKDGMTKE